MCLESVVYCVITIENGSKGGRRSRVEEMKTVVDRLQWLPAPGCVERNRVLLICNRQKKPWSICLSQLSIVMITYGVMPLDYKRPEFLELDS